VTFLQLTHPLSDRHPICARHDAVSEISESMGSRHSINNLQDRGDGSCTALARSDLSTILSSVLEMLGKSLDIQRGITRIFHCKATAKEVCALLFCSGWLQTKYFCFHHFVYPSLLNNILVTW
jgi:DNA mismatch repair protein MSH3